MYQEKQIRNTSVDNNCRGSWHSAESCINIWISVDGCHLVLSFRMGFAMCRQRIVCYQQLVRADQSFAYTICCAGVYA